MELIKAQNLEFEYINENNHIPVLKGIDIEIKKGEFVCILGHNGSGKSTLAKHFNAILTPSRGVVYIDGIDTSAEETVFDIRRKVGMVFQNPDNQIVATLVEEDVAFAPENLGIPPLEIRERVDNALKTVGMYEYREHSPHRLSGGQKQRVAIAGIIAMNPECIVLDEATSMLDPKGRKEVMSTIKNLNKKFGTTIIHITHYMEEAVLMDRVIVMDSGNVILDNTPKNVFKNIDILKSVGLDVPQVTLLLHELKKFGIDVNTDILTEEECLSELIRIIG